MSDAERTERRSVDQAGTAEPAADAPSSAVPARRGNAELQRLHRLLRGRYKWAVLLSLCFATVGAWGGVRLGQKTYQSFGILRLRAVLPKVMYAIDEKGALPMYEQFAETQVTLLRSQRVADKAMEDPLWQGRPETTPAGKQAWDLTKNLDVSREGELIWIKVTHPDPQVAMIGVTSVTNAFKQVYSETETESGEAKRRVLETNRTNLSNQLGGLRQQILDDTKVYGSDDLRPEYAFKLSQVQKLETLLDELKAAIPLAVKGAAAATQPSTRPTEELPIEQLATMDGVLARYLGERDQRAREVRALAAKGLLQNSTQMREAQTNLAEAEADVQRYARVVQARVARSNRALAEGATTDLGATQSAEALTERLAMYTAMYDQAKHDLQQLNEHRLHLDELRARADKMKLELEDTNRTLDQMALEEKLTGRLIPLSDASRPAAPFRDTRASFAAAGGLGGVCLGFGIVMLIGMANQTLDRPGDAHHGYSEDLLLGVLPQLAQDAADPQHQAMTSHAVHAIRTRLMIGSAGQRRVFGVTSPSAGAGKTSLTLALGVSFASGHLRTLVIDCDLVGGALTERVNAPVRRKIGQILRRNGTISERQLDEALELAAFAGRPVGDVLCELGYLTEQELTAAIALQDRDQLGLLDALGGEPLEHCVAQTGVSRMDILPLGTASAEHVGRLTPHNLRILLEAARERYDVVLVDTGPIIGSLESAIVASQVSSVLFVVSRGEQQGWVAKALRELNCVNSRLAGIVFNRARESDIVIYDHASRTGSGSGGSRPIGTPAGPTARPSMRGADDFVATGATSRNA